MQTLTLPENALKHQMIMQAVAAIRDMDGASFRAPSWKRWLEKRRYSKMHGRDLTKAGRRVAALKGLGGSLAMQDVFARLHCMRIGGTDVIAACR